MQLREAEQMNNYFRAEKGYHRLFEAFKNKYKSLGRIGGSVVLKDLTFREREVLSIHLKEDFTKRNTVKVNMRAFEKSLAGTKFEDRGLKEILGEYFDEELTGKKEDEMELEIEKKRFFEGLFSVFQEGKSHRWLKAVKDGSANGSRSIDQRLFQVGERSTLFCDMEMVAQALDVLPGNTNSTERLPVFASRITKDPHGFDFGTPKGNMLFQALCTLYETPSPKGSMEKAEVYYKAGILVDEISNFVTTSGLLAYKGSDKDGVWREAFESRQILQVPLINLSRIDRVESPIKTVFVVENPGVFAAILDVHKLASMVCTFGQPKLSGLVLLDLLVSNGTNIYYSGDFDPEGLQIAESLWRRYKERFLLWHYGIEDYEKARSDNKISPRRLSILGNITCPGLQKVATAIRATGCAGYQELILGDLISSLTPYTVRIEEKLRL